MTRFLLVLLALLPAMATAQPAPITIGQTHSLASKALNETRRIHVYQSPYSDTTRSHKVLYLLDASLHEDFLHVAGLVQFFALQGKLQNLLVVGIENVDRKRDFTHHTDLEELKKAYPTTGHSDAFIQFLETELQPWVKENFMVNDTSYIAGQSLGGLLGAEILLKKPQLFSHYLLVSPSMWWDDESLLKEAPSLIRAWKSAPAQVFVSVGAQEGHMMRSVGRKLASRLKAAKRLGMRIDFDILPGEDHASVLHQALYLIFREMWG